MGGSSGNVTWTLETESGDVILSGGPLWIYKESSQTKCLEAGLYKYDIIDENSDNFGKDCYDCGYFIDANGVNVGGSYESVFNIADSNICMQVTKSTFMEIKVGTLSSVITSNFG